jgi:hypothetical protein
VVESWLIDDPGAVVESGVMVSWLIDDPGFVVDGWSLDRLSPGVAADEHAARVSAAAATAAAATPRVILIFDRSSLQGPAACGHH